jgi:hypothetical protein
VVYASSNTDLYQVDPVTLAQTHLCTFTIDGGAPSSVITDIAVKGEGGLFGVTEESLYSIDPRSCDLTPLVALSSGTGKTQWVGLAFTADDQLIAADEKGDVVNIDTSSGAVTTVGHFGSTYGCSGDLVAIDDANQTIYASATDSSCTLDTKCTDVLVTLDPGNGYAAHPIGNIGYREVFGLGYWGGILYGFTHAGQTIQIDPDGGSSILIDSTQPAVLFSGGATTPLAPR